MAEISAAAKANFRDLMGWFGAHMGQFDYQHENQIGCLELK